MGWKRGDGRGNTQKCRAATHSNSDGHFTEPKPNSIVRVPDINTFFALGRHNYVCAKFVE